MSNVSFPYLGIEFTINRVAFAIGSFNIYWYGILIALGLLLGVWYAQKNASKVGLTDDNVLDIVIVCTVIGVFSGRLFYVLFADDYEIHSLKEFFNLRGGGTAFYGVLLGSLLSCIIVCKIRKIRLLPFLDLLGLGLLIGQCIGRWGNFFNQELFGTNTSLPWAMYSDTISRYVARNASTLYSQHGIVLSDAPVHPTFLYESLWCLIGFLLLSRLLDKRRFDGEVFLKYLVWNGIGRAVIEQLRTDALFLGRIRISQFVCSLLALTAFVALIMIRSTIRRLNDDEYLMPYVKQLERETASEPTEEKEQDSAELSAPSAESAEADLNGTDEQQDEATTDEEKPDASEKEEIDVTSDVMPEETVPSQESDDLADLGSEIEQPEEKEV